MSFSEDSDAPRTDFDVDDPIQDLETQSSINNLASSDQPTGDWFKNMTPEQLESMKQYIMKQQEEARLKKQREEEEARLKKQREEEEARLKQEEEDRLKHQQEEEARLKKQHDEEAAALARLKKQDEEAAAASRPKPFVPFSKQVLPPPRYHPLLPPTPSSFQQTPPPLPPRLAPISRPRPAGFIDVQKPSSNPKGETRIDVDDEQAPAPDEQAPAPDEQEAASKKHTPVPDEPYKPPKHVKEMRVDDDYKEDNVRPFSFQDEIEQIRQENEELKERLNQMETRMAAAEINIEDINNNAEDLRKDVDNSTKYTVELMKLDKSPRKIAKYVDQFHDVKKDVENLKNARPCGPQANDSFAEKVARAQLMQRELDNLKNMMETLASSGDKKPVPDQITLFKTYGWKLSNTIYRLRPVLSAEEQEKLDNACSFLRKNKRQSPKQVMNAIQQFIDTLMKNIYQRNSDMKLKGNEFQYHFPHLDDDDDDEDGFLQ